MQPIERREIKKYISKFLKTGFTNEKSVNLTNFDPV